MIPGAEIALLPSGPERSSSTVVWQLLVPSHEVMLANGLMLNQVDDLLLKFCLLDSFLEMEDSSVIVSKEKWFDLFL